MFLRQVRTLQCLCLLGSVMSLAQSPGSSGGAGQGSPAAIPAAPVHTFAPYIDMGKPFNNLPQIQAASGIRAFTLAFVVAGDGCNAAWAGKAPVISDAVIAGYVDKLRAGGGDVIIAFGGYDGLELAQVCPDVGSLQAAYQSVVDHYKAKILDLDIEHTAIEDPVSVERRSQALRQLALANPGLQINYTLPATPRGLTDKAVEVLNSAVRNGTPVSVVNVMAMDYGFAVPAGGMGPDAVAAAAGALCQMQRVGVKARVGITPMIGVNDSAGEVFGLADAQTVLSYAQANPGDVALLSFWSVGRDNGSCGGTVSPTCSGIAQGDWAFTKVFQQLQ